MLSNPGSSIPVVHSQVSGVRQRLDVDLDCIVPACQQGFEFWTGPQVAGAGPVDDLVFPATASDGELVEGEAQSQTAALPECFGLNDGLVVLRHREEPGSCKRPVIAENASLVDRRAVSFDVALEPIYTVFGHGLGEQVLQCLLSESSLVRVEEVYLCSACRLFDLEHVASVGVDILLDLRGPEPDRVQLLKCII